MDARWAALPVLLWLAACGGDPEARSDAPRPALGAGTPVPVAGETAPVATQAADAADDPAIWLDPRDPARGVILGTDKIDLSALDTDFDHLWIETAGASNSVYVVQTPGEFNIDTDLAISVAATTAGALTAMDFIF